MRLARLSAFLGFLATAALAADVTLYLTAPPNPYSLPPTTHATLTSLRRRIAAPLSASNAFVFRNVQPGSYLLDVHCSTDGFKPLRVDVTAADDVEVWETFRGNDWANRGERLALRDGSAGRGVDAKPLGGKQYFTERQKFSVLQILKSPMILMGIVGMVVVFGMPKLMNNLDPELKAEFEQRQKDGPFGGGKKAENPLQNFDMAAYLAGSSSKKRGDDASPKDKGGSRR